MPNTNQKGSWQQLRQEDRDRMQALIQAGHNQKEIADILKVNPSTISRERKRRREDGRYDAAVAGIKARNERRHSKYQGMKVQDDPALREYVIAELEKKRSPDEIAGRMKRDKLPFYASKNAIYHWLYSAYGQRYCQLLCAKHWHKKKQKKKTARVMIPNRKSIDLRPLGAANKTRYRHFEGDTAVASKKVANTEALALTAERISKFLLGTKIVSLSSKEMTRAVKCFAAEVRIMSMTLDNGIENREHERWKMPAYFADPHAPWQKPVIENSIGLLRRWFFKKGTDWAKVSEAELQSAIGILNNKYRKSLNYQSALEVAGAHDIIINKKNPRRDCN